MLKLFDKLRSRPAGERKSIALFSAVSLSAIVVMIWWSTFTSPVNVDAVKAADNVASPLGIVGGFFSRASDGAKKLPNQILRKFQNSATSTTLGGMDTRDIVSASDLLTAVGRATASSTLFKEPAQGEEGKKEVPTPLPPADEAKVEKTETFIVVPPPPVIPKIAPAETPASANLIPIRPTKVAPSTEL